MQFSNAYCFHVHIVSPKDIGVKKYCAAPAHAIMAKPAGAFGG